MGASIQDDPIDPIIALADWRGVSTYRPNPDAGPDIELSTPRIDFGAVAFEADTVVTVTNRGTAVLEVTEVTPPGGFEVDPQSFSLGAGESQEVTITAVGPDGVRSFVRYLSNDPDEASVRQYVYKNNDTFPQIGSVAPDFTLLGNDGEEHTLSDYRGKVVFLEFGANW
ncbi:MAG: redoxin domain-containing protein [Candidatus Eisenbacteria bacterium]|nr:redoxin domain-containing protein [Candidatus Latescibacterota bacterium]MBD3300939.1 redoxin domain-containing protein [Candidatus Eisenbacteria bacterium]